MNRSTVISHIEKAIPYKANFLKELRDLDHLCEELQQFYHEYDYSSDKPGNGFRSIVRITEIYFEKLHRQQENGNFTLYPELLQDYVILADTLQRSFSYAHLLRKKGVNFDITIQTGIDVEFFRRVFEAPVESTAPVAGSIGPFYYKGNPGPIVHWLLYLLHLWQLPLSESSRMLFDSKYSANRMAESAARTPLSMLKALIPGPVASSLVWPLVRLAASLRFATVTEISVPRRTNRWTIHIPDWKQPAVIAKTAVRGRSFRSLLIRPWWGKNESNSIIIHGHGGGFITNAPEAFVASSSALSGLLGIPIIIPDYRKAPEHRFPAGLQDVLDLYIFLMSADEEVEALIGFQPEHVFMCGDSAGANLVTAATFALNRIRKQDDSVEMPKAIMLQYPAVVPTFVAVPSFCFVLIDIALCRGTLALSGALYGDIEPKIVDESDWGKTFEENLETVKKLAHKLKDPLFNLLAFQDWDDLKDIPLTITACEMDPTLDQAIMLAKAWKGKVDFDIAKGMPHGYAGFAGDSSIREEISLYQRQIAHAVGVEI